MSPSSQPVLVADIGGTNARFALADTSQDAPLQKDSIREYAVAEFPSLGNAARHHLEQIGASAGRGVFAVAGRVEGGAEVVPHKCGAGEGCLEGAGAAGVGSVGGGRIRTRIPAR